MKYIKIWNEIKWNIKKISIRIFNFLYKFMKNLILHTVFSKWMYLKVSIDRKMYIPLYSYQINTFLAKCKINFFSKIHFKWEIISTGFVVFAESVIKMECKQINVNTIVKMLSIMTLTWKALEKLILFIEDIEKFIFEETNIYFKHFCNIRYSN